MKRARILEERTASIEQGHRIQGNCRLSDTVHWIKTEQTTVKYRHGPDAGEGGRVVSEKPAQVTTDLEENSASHGVAGV